MYCWAGAGCTLVTADDSEALCSAALYTHTHIRLTAFFLGLPGWASTRKVKPIWILLKQETVSGSGISLAICMSASRSRQITMPVPRHSSFLQPRCRSCCPTNSVKALKALYTPVNIIGCWVSVSKDWLCRHYNGDNTVIHPPVDFSVEWEMQESRKNRKNAE